MEYSVLECYEEIDAQTRICSNPECIHGGIPQPLTNFWKKKDVRSGYCAICKDCGNAKSRERYRKNKEKKHNYYLKNKDKKLNYNKRYYENNKDRILAKNKEYRENNKDSISKQRKKYREENQEKITSAQKKYFENNAAYLSEYKKNYLRSLAKFDSFYNKIVTYEECQRDPINSDLIQVRCKNSNCREWFNPTVGQLTDRIRAINNLGRGDSNLYCSDTCKTTCPIYRRVSKISNQSFRSIQPELREMVFDRDNSVCFICGRSKDDFPELIFHCHHVDPIINNPIESADIDNCITLCKECHLEVHMSVPGCGFSELKCR